MATLCNIVVWTHFYRTVSFRMLTRHRIEIRSLCTGRMRRRKRKKRTGVMMREERRGNQMRTKATKSFEDITGRPAKTCD